MVAAIFLGGILSNFNYIRDTPYSLSLVKSCCFRFTSDFIQSVPHWSSLVSRNRREKNSQNLYYNSLYFSDLLCCYWQIWSAPEKKGFCVRLYLQCLNTQSAVHWNRHRTHHLPYYSNTYRTVAAPDIYSMDRWFQPFLVDSRHIFDRKFFNVIHCGIGF